MSGLLQAYVDVLKSKAAWRWRGSVAEANGQTIESDGPPCSVGECCEVLAQDGTRYEAEVIGFRGRRVVAMPLLSTRGLRHGDAVFSSGGGAHILLGESYSVSTTNVGGNTALVAGDPPAVLSDDVQGGAIGGMLEARDQDIPGMQAQLDELAYAVGNAVNQQNEAGNTSVGAAGGAVFSLPTSAAGAAGAISVTGSSFASAGAGEGSAGTSNALALAGLGTAVVASGQTASDFFASFIGELGATVSSASTQSTADTASLTQAQTRRDSLSAVSLDDEASQLTQYQRSYEAAAKVFSIVDDLYATVLNLGQETAVS